jgi:hypothetical protein
MRRHTLALLAGLLLAPGTAQAATRYISPTGTGTACTQTAPCGTLKAAYAVAVAGDTILFTQGSYAAQGTSSQPSISGTKAVTVQGNGTVKIRQINMDASNVTFDGFDLDAAGTTTSGAVFETGGGANIVFKNGRIGNVVDEKGALVGGNVDPTPLNNTFDNVVFHDIRVQNTTTHNEAMYIMAPAPSSRTPRSAFRRRIAGTPGRSSRNAAHGGASNPGTASGSSTTSSAG